MLGKYKEANKCYDAAIKENPVDVILYYNKGLSL